VSSDVKKDAKSDATKSGAIHSDYELTLIFGNESFNPAPVDVKTKDLITAVLKDLRNRVVEHTENGQDIEIARQACMKYARQIYNEVRKAQLEALKTISKGTNSKMKYLERVNMEEHAKKYAMASADVAIVRAIARYRKSEEIKKALKDEMKAELSQASLGEVIKDGEVMYRSRCSDCSRTDSCPASQGCDGQAFIKIGNVDKEWEDSKQNHWRIRITTGADTVGGVSPLASKNILVNGAVDNPNRGRERANVLEIQNRRGIEIDSQARTQKKGRFLPGHGGDYSQGHKRGRS